VLSSESIGGSDRSSVLRGSSGMLWVLDFPPFNRAFRTCKCT